jgi:uncharacterized protein (DUF3084 family)
MNTDDKTWEENSGEIERLRLELASYISDMDKLGDNVVELRKKFRKALQDLDILDKQLRAENTFLRGLVVERDRRIAMLETQLIAARLRE